MNSDELAKDIIRAGLGITSGKVPSIEKPMSTLWSSIFATSFEVEKSYMITGRHSVDVHRCGSTEREFFEFERAALKAGTCRGPQSSKAATWQRQAKATQKRNYSHSQHEVVKDGSAS